MVRHLRINLKAGRKEKRIVLNAQTTSFKQP